MDTQQMPHPEHDKHLCYLENIGYIKSNLETYKELVRQPQYVCRKCGRAAAGKNRLCKPEKL